MAKILVFIALMIGEQEYSLDGYPGLNQMWVTAEELETLGMDTVAKVQRKPFADRIERVQLSWDGGHEEWVRTESGHWTLKA